MILGGCFEVSDLKKQKQELTYVINDNNIWQDQIKANNISRSLSDLNKTITEYEELENEIITIKELNESGIEENELSDYIDIIVKRLTNLELKTYLKNEFDQLNIYLEIHPGAGGTESCDWAEMLLRMYEKFCEQNEYDFEIINLQKGEEAGIKNALVKISGSYAYGYLKNEAGIHRLVRISPFDSNKRRHTSFASVSITPEFNNNISVDIKEEDLKIDVYHSSGAGGQSVNTSNSAVRITHLPSKIVVTCQNERSQLKNKEVALKILKNKLYEKEIEKQESLEKQLKNNDNINFGSQIRSYFLEPYKLVKDHRTEYESTDPYKILDGNILELLKYNLKNIK